MKTYKVSNKTSEDENEPKKLAIVLRCPDLRFREPHKEFLFQELGLTGGSYFSLKRAGGAIALARPEQMGADFKSIVKEMNIFLKAHPEATHIIITNHEDCKRYDEALDRENSPKNPERKDLTKASINLTKQFAGMQIGAYYLKFVDETQKEVEVETVWETDPRKSLRKH